MGRNILRREAVALLGLLLAGAPAHCQSAPGPGTDAEPLASAGYARPLFRTPEPALDGGPAPLPAEDGAQPHEVFSLDFPDEPSVEGFLQSFLANKREWLEAVLSRTLLYRGLIAERIRTLGMPPELLFLPAVESGFQATAMSPRGASGLWQLMRNTASPYGLTMDPWIDERRDFWKATDASLAKLADDYRLFGDWDLALAAYNCGASRLSRIIRQSGTADYWQLRRARRLPRETASFVPQFLAVTRILSSPARYGIRAPWTPPTAWARVPVGRCVDLGLLSRASGVPYGLLRAGNAELTMAITPPAGYRYQLKVPEPYRASVETALDSAALPLLDFVIYTVRPGDTLSGIARSHGVKVDMIAGFNPAVRPDALRVGSRLLVPLPARAVGARPGGAGGDSG